MPSEEEVDPDDGRVPFADRRFNRKDMIEIEPPAELAQLLDRQIADKNVHVPTDEFMEVRCVSKEFATAVFMVKRGTGGQLMMLAPAGAIRKPN